MKLSISSVKKTFQKLCGPAQFYLVLSLLSLVIYLVQMLEHRDKMNTATGLTMQAIIVIVWTAILNWVCSLKYGNKVAWFLVFLPIILLFTMLIVFYHMVDTMGITKQELQTMVSELNEDSCEECSK